MIQSENFILRALKASDIEKLTEMRADIDFRNQVMMHPFPITKTQEDKWIDKILNDNNANSVYFAVADRDDHKLFGIVNFTSISFIHQRAEFGIYLSPEARGKGVGREATQQMLHFGFNSLNLRKVELKVVSNNSRAVELYQKLGFELTATLKEHFYCDGKFTDVLLMTKFRR